MYLGWQRRMYPKLRLFLLRRTCRQSQKLQPFRQRQPLRRRL
jgi:hypothetical protein